MFRSISNAYTLRILVGRCLARPTTAGLTLHRDDLNAITRHLSRQYCSSAAPFDGPLLTTAPEPAIARIYAETTSVGRLDLDDHRADFSWNVDMLGRGRNLIECVGAGDVEFCG